MTTIQQNNHKKEAEMIFSKLQEVEQMVKAFVTHVDTNTDAAQILASHGEADVLSTDEALIVLNDIMGDLKAHQEVLTERQWREKQENREKELQRKLSTLPPYNIAVRGGAARAKARF